MTAKVYAVAQSVPPSSDFFTTGHRYPVLEEDEAFFTIVDDEGDQLNDCSWQRREDPYSVHWVRVVEAEEPAAEAPADATITALAEANAEIARLRGLLIDPGDPAWEDARAILAAELDKAGLTDRAASVRHGHADYVPSWIALNLIAQAAARAALEGVRQ